MYKWHARCLCKENVIFCKWPLARVQVSTFTFCKNFWWKACTLSSWSLICTFHKKWILKWWDNANLEKVCPKSVSKFDVSVDLLDETLFYMHQWHVHMLRITFMPKIVNFDEVDTCTRASVHMHFLKIWLDSFVGVVLYVSNMLLFCEWWFSNSPESNFLQLSDSERWKWLDVWVLCTHSSK